MDYKMLRTHIKSFSNPDWWNTLSLLGPLLTPVFVSQSYFLILSISPCYYQAGEELI